MLRPFSSSWISHRGRRHPRLEGTSKSRLFRVGLFFCVLKRWRRIESYFSVSWFLIVVTMVAFAIGSRAAYRVFEAANVGTACAVIVRIGPRYWGGQSWFTSV